MFKKRVSLGSQSLISSKDRKTLLAALQTAYPSSQWPEILPQSSAIEVCKIAGSKGKLYVLKEEAGTVPAFVDRTGKGEVFPSVFVMWRAPEAVRGVEVWEGVSGYLMNGADLMWPGVCNPLAVANLYPVNTYLSIKVHGNPLPLAIGRVLDSGSTLSPDHIAGKFLEVVHIYRDELWKLMPTVPNEGFSFEMVLSLAREETKREEGEADGGTAAEQKYDAEFPPMESAAKLLDSQTLPASAPPQAIAAPSESISTPPQLVSTPPDSISTPPPDQSQTDPTPPPLPPPEESKDPISELLPPSDPLLPSEPVPDLPPDQYDENIRLCFLTTLKLAIQPSDLPIEPSRIQSLMPLCKPKDMPIDFKRSNYKKIGTFLKAMQKAGLLTYSKPKGGDHELVTAVNASNEMLAGFQPIVRQMAKPKTIEEVAEGGGTPYPKVRYTHVLRPGKDLRKFFAGIGQMDIDSLALTREDAQRTLKDYISTKELEVGTSSKKFLRADDGIAAVVGVVSGVEVEKANVYMKFLGKFIDGYVKEDLTGVFPEEMKTGGIPKITLTLSRKIRNKKTTLIEGLEHYNIDPSILLHNLQHLLATSGFLQPKSNDSSFPPKIDVQIMGAKYKDSIINVLTEYYKVPPGCVDVKDFIKPKGGNR